MLLDECRMSTPGTRAALRSIEIEPGLAEGYSALGLIENSRWQWIDAERHLRQALTLNPGLASAYQRLALNYTVRKRFDEAQYLLRTAQTLDPLQWFIEYNLGELYFYWRRYDDVLGRARRIEELRGRNGAFLNLTIRVYSQQGRYAEIEQLCRQRPRDEFTDFHCELARLRSDYPKQLALVARQTNLAAAVHGYAYGSIGQIEEAFRWLEQAYSERDPDLPSLAIDPTLDPLRKDPRYRALVERMGLTP